MYPNPTSGIVILDLGIQLNNNREVSVRNLSGQEILRKKFMDTEQVELDVSDYVSGIYLVVVVIGNNQIIRKLLLDTK